MWWQLSSGMLTSASLDKTVFNSAPALVVFLTGPLVSFKTENRHSQLQSSVNTHVIFNWDIYIALHMSHQLGSITSKYTLIGWTLTFQQWQFLQLPIHCNVEPRWTISFIFFNLWCTRHRLDFCQLSWGWVIFLVCIWFPLLQIMNIQKYKRQGYVLNAILMVGS